MLSVFGLVDDDVVDQPISDNERMMTGVSTDMACIINMGNDRSWKIKNSIYGEFVELVLARPMEQRVADTIQVSEYGNGLDLVTLAAGDEALAREVVNHLLVVAAGIAAGEYQLDNGERDVRRDALVREAFAKLVRYLSEFYFNPR